MSSALRPPPSVIRRPLSALRLVFMGTPAFALPALKVLHEAGHEIVAVYTQPPRPAGRGWKETPSPVHGYALAHGISVYTPVSLKTAEAQAQFAAHKADAAIVAAYGLLLPKPVLDAYPLGCINIHPSLLPRWRGAAPIQRALIAGDTETALCIMRMEEGLDSGPVLALEHVVIPPEMDAGELHDALAERACPLLLATLEALTQGKITPQPQSEEGITYARKITKDDCRIDWTQPASAIASQIRGLSPAPGAFFLYQGEHIKIFAASPHPNPLPVGEESAGASQAGEGIPPGTVLSTEPLAIACGSGVLLPHALQRPGKKRVQVQEFIHGFPLKAGAVLE